MEMNTLQMKLNLIKNLSAENYMLESDVQFFPESVKSIS